MSKIINNAEIKVVHKDHINILNFLGVQLRTIVEIVKIPMVFKIPEAIIISGIRMPHSIVNRIAEAIIKKMPFFSRDMTFCRMLDF